MGALSRKAKVFGDGKGVELEVKRGEEAHEEDEVQEHVGLRDMTCSCVMFRRPPRHDTHALGHHASSPIPGSGFMVHGSWFMVQGINTLSPWIWSRGCFWEKGRRSPAKRCSKVQPRPRTSSEFCSKVQPRPRTGSDLLDGLPAAALDEGETLGVDSDVDHLHL